ncbi:hypothetical protein, partial [Nocardia tenerifensis]|uniref:hypothetical protein n=1 Tax=Nocardia tenerifensis TaxID=228006 RepID=UPI001C3F4B7C
MRTIGTKQCVARVTMHGVGAAYALTVQQGRAAGPRSRAAQARRLAGPAFSGPVPRCPVLAGLPSLACRRWPAVAGPPSLARRRWPALAGLPSLSRRRC